MANVLVMGSGSWGTAISISLVRGGHDVYLWSRRAEFGEELRTSLENKRYLPGVKLPEKIVHTSDVGAARHAEVIVIATPSHTVRDICRAIAPYSYPGQIVVSISKGFDEASGKRLSEVVSEEIPSARVAVMSGPSHAEEVAVAMPTTNVVASESAEAALRVQEIFNSQSFRIYTSDDVVGVELGGALKNVIALCAGICDGLGYGDNAKAALITRGIAEITRLGVAMGAKPLTFSGLSGIGDLVVTCTSAHSRNRRAGYLIGKGYTKEEAEAEVKMVVEGIKSARAVHALSARLGIEMPISEEAYRVLYEGADVKDSLPRLMGRDAKPEIPDRGFWV